MRHGWKLAAIAALAGLAAGAARADDRYSLDPDMPVRVEDAFPLDPGDAYLKVISRYAHGPDSSDVTTIQPEVAAGIAPDTDLHISAPYLIGEGDRSGSGLTNVNVQHLFLEQHEGDWFPSIAVEGDLLLPTGVHSEGVDTAIQVIATQTLSWSPAFDAVHLNLTWTHNFCPDAATERDDAYTAIVGYSRRIAEDTVFVTDFVWERTIEKDNAGQLAEVGLIQKLGEHVQLAAGVGVGLGDDAPDFTATIGVILSR